MKAASQLNEQIPNYIVGKVEKLIGGYKGKKIAVLGLAFKSGTSDARKSPGIKIANLLNAAGANVTTFDPQANGEAKHDLKSSVSTSDSLNEATKGTHAVFIATDWPEFKNMDLADLAKTMKGKILIDCMNCLDPAKVKNSGLQYIGIGRS